MASLRELRGKIKSVKSTQQITKAMKMVATARLRRAQARIVAARPFADKLEKFVTDLIADLSDEATHPLITPRSGPKRLLLIVTSDKGLCGAFNTNLFRHALAYIRQHGTENVELFVVGRKGRDYFSRLHRPIRKEYVNIFHTLSFTHAEVIAQDVTTAYLSEPIGAVDAMFNEFRSVIQQKVMVKTLLPMCLFTPAPSAKGLSYLYEPSKNQILSHLLPRLLKAQLFRILLESAAAELGARMAAMENATQNATELLSALTLTLNRTRQASITKEILEVVSGAEALR